MIDQIGTGRPNGRIVSIRRFAKLTAIGIAAIMVATIMAIWGAFLVWAAFRSLTWLLHILEPGAH